MSQDRVIWTADESGIERLVVLDERAVQEDASFRLEATTIRYPAEGQQDVPAATRKSRISQDAPGFLLREMPSDIEAPEANPRLFIIKAMRPHPYPGTQLHWKGDTYMVWAVRTSTYDDAFLGYRLFAYRPEEARARPIEDFVRRMTDPPYHTDNPEQWLVAYRVVGVSRHQTASVIVEVGYEPLDFKPVDVQSDGMEEEYVMNVLVPQALKAVQSIWRM